MKSKKDIKNLTEKTDQPEAEINAGRADVSKRRLLKGIAATAPVVMAVSSKPALANFCTVSGFLSGNLSNQNTPTYCGGRSPGYWMNHVTPKMKRLSRRFLRGFGKAKAVLG